MNLLNLTRRPLSIRNFINSASPRYLFTTWRPVRTLQDETVETFRSTAFGPSLPAKLPEVHPKGFPSSAKWFQEPGPTFNGSYLGQFRNQMVPIELTRPAIHPDGEAIFERAEAPLGIFLGWAEQAKADSSQRLYVAQASIDRLPELLQKDVPTPELVARAGKGDVYDSSIWLGVAPTYTPLHRDPNPNMYLQLAGRKVIRLLDPDVGRSVFARVHATLGSRSSSKFRGDEMMKGQEKRLLEAEIWSHNTTCPDDDILGFEAELDAGQALFIPQGWWHSVKSVGTGCTGSEDPRSEQLAAVQIAIDTAQPERLRQALSKICAESAVAAQLAQDILLVPIRRSISPSAEQRDKNDDNETDESESESVSDSGSKQEALEAEAASNVALGLKRMRPRYAMCSNCEEEFDVTENQSGGCIYHPGEMEVDWDGGFWDDHDENCHGPIDDEDRRIEYPEGFIYDCCDRKGDSEGCETTRHIEKIPAKRMRRH
ncbi:MAG: hypothetical protein Q9200_006025 [Gallowayella weberi]